jgi:hypothetical protein
MNALEFIITHLLQEGADIICTLILKDFMLQEMFKIHIQEHLKQLIPVE